MDATPDVTSAPDYAEPPDTWKKLDTAPTSGSSADASRASGFRAEAAIATLAAAQHGLVTLSQLLGIGLSRRQVRYRQATDRLVRLLPRVYRASSVVSPLERYAAALLACGHSATLSFRSAGVVLRFLADEADRAAVDITIAARRRISCPGVHSHRSGALPEDEIEAHSGLRVTTPARTLVDLAGTLTDRELEQAVAATMRLRLESAGSIREIAQRYPRRPGLRRLLDIIGEDRDPAYVRSEAELRFLELTRAAGLESPECNVRVRGYEVDFLWRRQRVVVEIDGFAFHSTRESFERDRRRDTTLEAAGLRVLRFTWLQLTREPFRVVAQVAEVLGRSFTG